MSTTMTTVPKVDLRLKNNSVNQFLFIPTEAVAQHDIDTKAASIGLGSATCPVTATPDQKGFFRDYPGGQVLWRADRGALAVYGAIFARWVEIGGVGGFFGWPQTDELGTPTPPGRYNHFDGGSIYWTPGTGAHLVYGAIRDLWSSVGWERSALGFPTTDERDVPGVAGARESVFEGGVITFTPAIGARITALHVPAESGGGVKIQTTGSPDPVPVPQVSRHVIISAAMDITDDETWASNEHRHVEGRDERWVDSWDPQGVMQLIGKCGGEVRVEINATAAVRPDGSIRLNVEVKLFEGTSEETNDLDGQRSVDQVVPAGGVVSVPIRINNDDEGGDYADISLTVSNSAT